MQTTAPNRDGAAAADAQFQLPRLFRRRGWTPRLFSCSLRAALRAVVRWPGNPHGRGRRGGAVVWLAGSFAGYSPGLFVSDGSALLLLLSRRGNTKKEEEKGQ